MNEEDQTEMNLGSQPLDALLKELGLDNHKIVDASTEQISHKMVAKGRKGRRLTKNLQRKLLRAVNSAAADDRTFEMGDLFNYRGK
ncbi:MAG: hypothetical protein ACI8UO_002383 [Verrucomicrobiales bacterium]|jgi:hypothetical protein